MADMTPAQERDKLKTEKKRKRAEDKKMGAQIGGDLGALAASAGFSILFTKVPRMQSFDKAGKVRTKAILAVPLYFGGMAMGDDILGGSVRGLGLIYAAQEIDKWVSGQTWAQPAV